MMGLSPSPDAASDELDWLRKEVSSELLPRRLFELVVPETLLILMLFIEGSEPVEVALLNQKVRRPKTAFSKPQPELLFGDVSTISVIAL